MARLQRKRAVAAGWWNDMSVSHDQEQARQHKAQAVHHENQVKRLKGSIYNWGGWNPISALAINHHEKLAEHHRAKQDYHESRANTNDEKRDKSGRWTASMAVSSGKGQGMSRRQHYEARRARQMAMGLSFGPQGGISCGVLSGVSPAAFNFVVQGLTAAMSTWLAFKLSHMHIKAATKGAILEVRAQDAAEAAKAKKLIEEAKSKGQAEAASFSCPPKFHKLYASYSMSDDGQTVMKDGKPCSSRRAAYYAASAAKFHKLFASQAAASGTSRRAKYEAKKRGMASPNGQMPSSNPGFGDRNVVPFEAGVID